MSPHKMQSLSILFAAFPDRSPGGSSDDRKAIFGMWDAAFGDFTDAAFRATVTRFILETPKLFPGDNPIAMIRRMGKPDFIETTGDCVELLNEAVSEFGSYRETAAMKWIEARSPLIAAAVKRFGFREYCMAENAEVARGQIRAIFEAEKLRAKELGGIVQSAARLEGGKTPAMLGKPESIGSLMDGLKQQITLKKDAA